LTAEEDVYYNMCMRILIVEDDIKVGRFLRRGLEEEHYAVDVCRTGNDALYYARINSYDVIILDIMLPGKDGFTVCRELREQAVLTPILMLTARDSIEDKVQGLSEGADDYLTKPFSFVELLARLRALMRRNQEYKSGSLKAGNLELSPLDRQVTMEGQRIELTGKEYALLEFLLRNKGRVLSPTMIIEHVWSMNYEGDRNIVNVYINRLREKIARLDETKLIYTVRGYGYKIDDSDEV
jgi:DNA-binding response OmpR family regulator